jgi:hypothetical protein
MNQSRRNSLTGVAFRIALRIREIARPYTDRGEETPRDLLAKEFHDVCDEYDHLRGGPLTTDEMQLVANKWVPRALRQIDQREQRRKEGFPK